MHLFDYVGSFGSGGPVEKRVESITKSAIRTFGDADFAREWLNSPNPALEHRIPIELAKTEAGSRQVEAVLTRFAHGDYA